MNFDISALSPDFCAGLAELRADYKFSLNGKIVLAAEHGQPCVVHSGVGYIIRYTHKSEFYRGFLKLLNGRINFCESRAFGGMCVMADCSRNAVLTVPAIKRLIRVMAVAGYSALELYTEDTYTVKGEPLFGYMRGAYTREEIGEIDRYAAIFGIELVPCIQTLAHLNGITRWERFKPLIDCNDILLADEGETYELIDKMFASVAECFTSRRIHIGMDEAHMVGLGKYLDKNGYRNRFDILLKHLNMVLDIAEKYGFKCKMWSDMFFRLANGGKYEPSDTEIPESVKKSVPENVTLDYWDYYRNDKAQYEKMLAKHKSLGGHISFACGAWRWNSFTPSNKMSISRNKLALEACGKFGVDEVTVTLWGDDGGECSTFAMLPALVASAEFAYGNCNYGEAVKVITGLSCEDFSALELADNPAGSDGAFFGGNFTKIFLYNDLLCGIYDYCVKPQYKSVFMQAAEKCKDAAKKNRNYACLFRSAGALFCLVGEKYDLGVQLREAYGSGDRQRLKTLAERITRTVALLDKFYREFKRQWDTENKPFGFEVQDIRLGGLRMRLLHCREIINDYLGGKTQSIPELEQEILPTGNYSDTEEFRSDDRWQQIASVNRI